jgi:cell division septation protein DedD
LAFDFLLLTLLTTFAVMSAASQHIEKTLAELLYNHNCVIIPGFGALVGNRAAAYLDENKNTFYPPYKKLVFNAQLQMNDGLLVQGLAAQSSLGFEEILSQVENVVKNWQEQLRKGKQISLIGVGVFKRTKDKSIAFHQDFSVNFLPESYGLQAIHVVALQKVNIKEKITRQIIDSSVPSAKKEGMTFTQVAAAVVVPILAASALFLSLNLGKTQTTTMNWNPFAGKSDEAKVMNDNRSDVVISMSAQIAESNDELLAMYTKKAVENNAEKHRALADSTEVAVSAPTLKPASHFSAKYHVIAGCFASEENAAKYLEEIKAAGFDAHLAGKTPNGLTRVAYGSYNNRTEAIKALADARAKHSREAWMSAE